MTEMFLDLLNHGRYWPALAAGLLASTHLLRRKGADRLLARVSGADVDDVRRLRPWIPLVLSAGAFLAAWLSGAVNVAEAAVESVVAAVVAMAGHDTGQAVRALLRALLGPTAGNDKLLFRRGGHGGHGSAPRRPSVSGRSLSRSLQPRPGGDRPPPSAPSPKSFRTRARATAGCLLLACSSVGFTSTGCVRPTSQPLALYVDAAVDQAAPTETVRECRRMRERSLWTAAGAAVASSVAGGLTGVRETVDGRGWVIGLGVGGILAAGAGAGLALASTSYQGALDAHCTPWPSQEPRL